MSRRGDNIHKRKDGRWEGRYIKYRNENNKAIYASVYGKTYTEVKIKLDEAKTNLQLNDDYEKVSLKVKINSYKEYKEYMKYYNELFYYVMDINKRFKKYTDVRGCHK